MWLRISVYLLEIIHFRLSLILLIFVLRWLISVLANETSTKHGAIPRIKWQSHADMRPEDKYSPAYLARPIGMPQVPGMKTSPQPFNKMENIFSWETPPGTGHIISLT